MTEHEIQNAIMREVSSRGCLIFRANVGSGRTVDGRYFKTGLPKGFPDLFGMTPTGRAFFIEVKKPGGRASTEQKLMLKILGAFTPFTGICYSVDDAVRLLQLDRLKEEEQWDSKQISRNLTALTSSLPEITNAQLKRQERT